MRRIAGLFLGLILMVPAISVMASDDADYRDDFGDGNYSGNDGSLDFSGPWAEFGDTGGAGSGKVHVGPENCSNNRCLHIEGEGLVLATYGATRYADLSMFDHVGLSFDIQVVPQGLTTTDLVVEMYYGSKWTVVKTFDLSSETSQHKDIDVTQYAGPNSAVRFRVLDVISGGILGLDLVYTGYATIDRVTLSGTLETSSTTSTTTPTTTSTTRPTNTTSTAPQATTSSGGSTPTTTAPRVTTPTAGGSEEGSGVITPQATGATTTTTLGVATTTSSEGDPGGAVTAGPLPPDSPSSPPPVDGLRVTAGGVIADYQKGMMGEMDMTGVEVLGVEVTADFSMAVEFFEAARIWIAGLALVIAAAIIGGLDRRKARA